MKTKVVIIDSGVSGSSTVKNHITSSYVLNKVNEKWQMDVDDSIDLLGHGTAVASIICSVNSDVEIISIRINNEQFNIDESALIYSLDYILKNIDADIINISAGIVYTNEYISLNALCKKITEKGMLIISAFDNDGAVSYPAACESVVGVDVFNDYETKDDLVLLENNIVKVLVPNKYFRVEWLDKKTLIKGTSFACAYVSGLVSKTLARPFSIKNIEQIHTEKKRYFNSEPIEKPNFKIKKAIIFPINKETHALLRFKDKLDFEIIDIYDDPICGKVGAELYGFKINPFEQINCDENFDTIILSYTEDLSRLRKTKYKDFIIEKAKQFDKNIYSFEDLKHDDEHFFYPKVTRKNVPVNSLKLYKSTLPIVGVFGTSSKQGKFTLQQQIIAELKEKGYMVGSISTEPSGYLLGADYVFHFGYHANLDLYPWESISILNKMVWDIGNSGKDILITGCQSGTIHYDNSQINNFALAQYAFILGILADMYILCVNPHDDISYIENTINYLNSIDIGRVEVIVVFPIKVIETKSGIGYGYKEMVENEKSELLDKLKQKFELPVFCMNDDCIDSICQHIIDFF